jgi:hypothetical protein
LRGRGSGEGKRRGYKSLLRGLSGSPNTCASKKEDRDVKAKDIRGSENKDVEGSGISEKDGGIKAKGSGFYSALSDVPSIPYKRYFDP